MAEIFKVVSFSRVLAAYSLGVEGFLEGFSGSSSVSFTIISPHLRFYFVVLNTIFNGVDVILIYGGQAASVPGVTHSAEKS